MNKNNINLIVFGLLSNTIYYDSDIYLKNIRKQFDRVLHSKPF